jgi:hypothetical protein
MKPLNTKKQAYYRDKKRSMPAILFGFDEKSIISEIINDGPLSVGTVKNQTTKMLRQPSTSSLETRSSSLQQKNIAPSEPKP